MQADLSGMGLESVPLALRAFRGLRSVDRRVAGDPKVLGNHLADEQSVWGLFLKLRNSKEPARLPPCAMAGPQLQPQPC